MERAFGEEYHLFVFPDWEPAREALATFDFDLVLIDVNLPGMQGDEIINEISDDQRGTLILFPALSRIELRRLANRCGASGNIEKVLNPDKLRREFHKLQKLAAAC